MAENTNSGLNEAPESETARVKLRDQMKLFGALAKMTAKNGAVKTTKLAMPLMHGYVGTQPKQSTDDSADDVGLTNRLSDDEISTLKAVGEKLTFETIELASLAYPTVDEIEPYRAVRNENGRYAAPHLAQLISVGTALQRLLGGDEEQDDPNAPETGDDAEANFIATKEPVLLTALTADEYGYLKMPILPRMIRRVALNEREMMLMNQNETTQSTTMAITAGSVPGARSSAMNRNQMMMNNSSAFGTNSMIRSSARFSNAGASTGGWSQGAAAQSCVSCGCATALTTSVARYNDDGTCADTMCISCETKWRMRECWKLAVCEFIACVADEICVDGKFQMPKKVDEVGNEMEETKNIGEILLCCLGDAMCSTLHCLPTAICGPRETDCCVPPPALECNFAVEERD